MPKTQMLHLLLLAAGLAVGATACSTVHGDQALVLPPADHVAEEGPLAYTPGARARERELYEATRAILETTLPELERLKQELRDDLRALELPVVLAASDPILRRWGDPARKAHQQRVEQLFSEHQAALQRLHDEAWQQALVFAATKAPDRSPMDRGVTGDPLLDRTLVTYDETLERAFAFETLEADRNEWLLREIELFEVYSTFGDAAAAGLDGRITLFLGGDELADRPQAVLVLSVPEGVAPETRGFFQVMRHRVMRGPALVQDEGWRPANQGVPAVEISGPYLIATGIEPVIRTDVEGFDQLLTMSVIVDMQSAVFDEAGEVLGGVDWQVTFRVTNRGDVAWQIDGGRPAFNPDCEQARAVIDAARG